MKQTLADGILAIGMVGFVDFWRSSSWRVDYMGVACDDARRINDVWYYCDILTGEICCFGIQERVVPLYENLQAS